MADDDAFYMAIEDPREFRRELLGSSKDIIKLIQRYENLKDLRAEKIKKMYEFSDALSEINMILGKLKKTTPAVKLRNLNTKLKTHVKQKSEPKSKPIKGSSEVAKLQEELELIESKLEKLA